MTKGVEDGNGIGKVFGTWPGDETDEQLLAALSEVRKPATTEVRGKASPEMEELRKSVLMEALRAVENERLTEHEERLQEADCVAMYRVEHGEDAAYSLAIRDAENAIKALMHIEGKG